MRREAIFQGSFTELVTPFVCRSLDERSFRELVDWQISEGTKGLVAAASSGESATLSHDEHRLVIEWAVDQVRGRVPIVAGTASNSTVEAIELSIEAGRAGADAVLVPTPYYSKPTQEGLFRHFEAINDAIDIPIIIDNDPGRSVVDLSIETLKRLAVLDNIVGIKDASARMARVTMQRQALGAKFAQLSGDDASSLGFMAHGGNGGISTTSNVAPRLCLEFQRACQCNDYALARALHERLMPLHIALGLETNPAPVKYALSVLGRCRQTLRPPLTSVSESTELAVRRAMMHAALLN